MLHKYTVFLNCRIISDNIYHSKIPISRPVETLILHKETRISDVILLSQFKSYSKIPDRHIIFLFITVPLYPGNGVLTEKGIILYEIKKCTGIPGGDC